MTTFKVPHKTLTILRENCLKLLHTNGSRVTYLRLPTYFQWKSFLLQNLKAKKIVNYKITKKKVCKEIRIVIWTSKGNWNTHVLNHSFLALVWSGMFSSFLSSFSSQSSFSLLPSSSQSSLSLLSSSSLLSYLMEPALSIQCAYKH